MRHDYKPKGRDVGAIVGWMMGLIFVYILWSHGTDTVNITNATTSGGVNVIKALQGR